MEHNLYDNDTDDYYDDSDTLIMGYLIIYLINSFKIFAINQMIVRKKMRAF